MSFFLSHSGVYVIAEIGVNHNGKLDLAKELILAAKRGGADAVKFQSFSAERLALKSTRKAKYQERDKSSRNHYQMLKRLELSQVQHKVLYDFCIENDITFSSTPYDVDSAKFLYGMGVTFFKTASADLVDLRLHNYIASTKAPVIISTGMSDIFQVNQTLEIYSKHHSFDLCLLHGVANYPCSDGAINLRSMSTLGTVFDLPTGYTDHSRTSTAAELAVALGARVIEKHVTLDKKLNGPDHLASADPDEFASYVTAIRRAERILGSPLKSPQPEESDMLEVARKSLVLRRGLAQGAVIEDGDLQFLRPGSGISPSDIGKVVGRRLVMSRPKSHILQWADLE